MISYKERHQSKTKSKTNNFKTTLINIDYLIMTLEGQPFGEFPESSNFTLKPYEYGTKIFELRADLYYLDIKVGVYTAIPRSSILSDYLAQLQIENNLFYTFSNQELKTLLTQFCDETNYIFKSINRLDICLDRCDKNNNYRSLYGNIINANYLISGRPKTFKVISKRTKEKVF